VNKEDNFIYRVITYDEVENITSDVELTVINLNEKISDELFTFQVPEGVQPVDMVEMIKAMFKTFEEKKSD
jgi:outer membrane lipoprotein-sorting protein